MIERANPASRGYAICTSGRSGSNLLCQYLSSTGMLGNPLEYFNGSGRRLLGYPEYPEDPAKQIDWILTEGATPNGIYGLKIFPAQVEQIEKSIRWAEFEVCSAQAARYSRTSAFRRSCHANRAMAGVDAGARSRSV
jgi:LPS sulfotransferase NodH